MTHIILGWLQNRDVQTWLAGILYMLLTLGGVIAFFRVTGSPENGQQPSRFWLGEED